MKTVCIITTEHSPDDVRVTYRIGTTFIKHGYKVDWIGPESKNIPSIDGLNFYFIKSSNRFFLLIKLFFKLCCKKYDAFYSVDPDSALLSLLLRIINHSKCIFDIHERYHDDLLRLKGFTSIKFNVFSFLLKSIIQFNITYSDFVIGVGSSRFEPYKFSKKRQLILGHCVPYEYVQSISREDICMNNFTILHGKAAISRGTIKILEVGKLLKEFYLVSDFKIIMFKLHGKQQKSNIDDFDKLIRSYGLNDNVVVLDSVQYIEMFKIMSTCHVGIIAYDYDLGINCVPNRFFEYISCGLPSIYPIFAKDLVRIDPNQSIGIPVDTSNPNEIANALYTLYNDRTLYSVLRSNCFSLYDEKLRWEDQVLPLLNFIDSN